MNKQYIYRVSIPNLSTGEVTASTTDHALFAFIVREMRKKSSDLWWRGRQYRGIVGEKALIQNVLNSNDKESFVRVVRELTPTSASSSSPSRLEIQGSLQFEFKTPKQISLAIEAEYDEGYCYELHTDQECKVRAEDAGQFDLLKKAHLEAKANNAREVLYLISKEGKREDTYNKMVDTIIDRAELDTTVQSLLTQHEMTVNDLKEIEVVATPFQSCDVPARINNDAIYIGVCREADHLDHMFESFVFGLTDWLQSKAGQEDMPSIRIHAREKSQALSLIKAGEMTDPFQVSISFGISPKAAEGWIKEANQVHLTSQSLEDILWLKGIPRAATRMYVESDVHPYWEYADPFFATHAVESIYDKYGGHDKSKILAIDFDGTIAQYKEEDFPRIGLPEEGAADTLRQLKSDGWKILIFSNRSRLPGQPEAMKTWLEEHNIPFDSIWQGKGKPMAAAFIDDRAIQYKGNWKEILQELKRRKSSGSIACKCGLHMIWDANKQLYRCARCHTNKVLERASIWVYAVKAGDLVKYTIGKQEFTSTLKAIANVYESRRIWKTEDNHLVDERAVSLAPVKEETDFVPNDWLS